MLKKKLYIVSIIFLFLINIISAEIIFQDDFNRPNNNTVGNGWAEGGTNGAVSIVNNKLKLNKSSSGGNLYVDHLINTTGTPDKIIYVSYNGTIAWTGITTDGDFFDFIYSTSGLGTERWSNKMHFYPTYPNDWILNYSNVGREIETGFGTSPLTLNVTYKVNVSSGKVITHQYSLNGGAVVTSTNLGWNSGDTTPYFGFLSNGDDTIINIDRVIFRNDVVSSPNLATNLTNKTYINRNSISIKVNTTNGIKTKIDYKLNNSAYSNLCANCNSTTLSLTSLSEGTYNLVFRSNYTNTISYLNRTFYVDTTNATITNNIPNNLSNYSFSGNWFSCSDVNLRSCNISIDGLNKASGTNFNLTHNGNLSYNITAIDLAGNIKKISSSIFINPRFYVRFNNNTNYVSNFQVNGTSYTTYFIGNIYTYGLGTKNFIFQKTGLEETLFNLTFNSTSKINTTIFINPVYIILDLKNSLNGSEAPISNYTILISEIGTNSSSIYNIINDNELIIENLYSSDTNISISVIFNSSITNTLSLITARQNVTIPIYITFETTSQRVIEVLTSSLTAVVGNEVYLYTFISGEGFVLETIKETNILGQVVFNIVELTRIYTICSTYNGQEKCLNQVTFVNAETDPYQIVHTTTFTPVEANILNYITWSYADNKTNISSQMTLTFNDAQSITSSFCYNVTRYTNNSPANLGSFCNNNPAGQVVNTFGLLNNQKITYTYYFIYNGSYNQLGTYTTYAENMYLILADQVNLFDVIFLIIYFGGISLLLKFKNINLYNIGILTLLSLIFLLQAYFNKEYVYIGIWTFIAITKGVYHAVRVEV